MAAATPWGCDICHKVYPVFEEAQMCERLCRAGRPAAGAADVVRALMHARLGAASAAFSEEMATEQRKASTRFASEMDRKLAEREREVIGRERAMHDDTHRTLRREHASTVGDLTAAHAAELQLAREQVTSDAKRQLLEARDRNAREIEQVTLALERLQTAYDAARKQDAEEHSMEMEKALIALRESHAAEMVEMETRFAARQEDHQKSVRKAVVEMQAEHRRKLEEVQSRETDARLHAAEQRHAAGLVEQENALNLEFQRLRDEEAEKLTQSVADLKAAYEERTRQTVSDERAAAELRLRTAVREQALADEVVFNERVAEFEKIVSDYQGRVGSARAEGGGIQGSRGGGGTGGRARGGGFHGGGGAAAASPPRASLYEYSPARVEMPTRVEMPAQRSHDATSLLGGGRANVHVTRRGSVEIRLPPALPRSVLLGQPRHGSEPHDGTEGPRGRQQLRRGAATQATQEMTFQSQLDAAMAPLKAFGGNDYTASTGSGVSTADMLAQFANPFANAK